LYSDGEGRVRISLRFNQMVRGGEVGPILIGRDHHDVSGTDSPYRETANIYDGSRLMAEMAHHSWVGDAVRGMTLVVLSNGGGVGVGKAINGGFGLVLDGSERVDSIIRSAVDWDVIGGVARRSWARNEPAVRTAEAWNEANSGRGQITLPHLVDEGLIEELVRDL
jgi:urocanate hydratase